ncbi:hypothetical protein B9Y60_10575 [Stenotrophomonas maltophilia]|uniref:hypothetical protein n=1 Tax=Stenotrophomonas maltophilia TaxID=40324 RepID=UPI000C268184|nr:hypothetical protein [Stenotrophomonas maltophilia]PJL52199.1 hypothetical protein B9Y73_10575 [Stenotrophomonas maltophilia]PJL55120.1 hypothetical protein B9Y60_10575 [Stenotrophomonas maltophilia]
MGFVEHQNGTWDTILTTDEVQSVVGNSSTWVQISFQLNFFTIKFDTTRLGDLVPYLEDLAQSIQGGKFKKDTIVIPASSHGNNQVTFTGSVELGDFFWLLEQFQALPVSTGKKELTKFMNDFLQVSGTKAVVEPRYY